MEQPFYAEYTAKPGSGSSPSLLKDDPLLITKRCIPSTRPHHVPRPRLIRALERGLEHKLTFLSAPTGFGKTMLLSEWAQQHAGAVAWVSLEKGDNDLVRFWRYIVDALEELHEGLAACVFPLLHTPQPPPFESILITLVNALAALSDPFTLILDDYHAIENQAIHETVTFLLDHLPASIHLMLSSRVHCPLPLARLRASGQLVELRMTDLLFTKEETATFLQQTMGLRLSPDEIAQLHLSTEGWIAGLHLAALSLRQCENIPAFISTFNGSHYAILDYLIDEVFSQQPIAIQTFLLHTAILDRLHGSLCDTVMDCQGSQVILEYLEQMNVFLIPLGEKRSWYRYSQLFRDFLRHRLEQFSPEMVPILYQRASLWFEQHDVLSEAVEYTLAACDFERAASLIARIGRMLVRNGEVSTVSDWLDRLPEHVLCGQPQLCLLCSWSFAMKSQLTLANFWLHRAKQDPGESATSALSGGSTGEAMLAATDARETSKHTGLSGEFFTLEAYIAISQGDIPRSIEAASQALRFLPEHDFFMRSAVTLNIGFAHSITGNVVAATRAFTEASMLSQATGDSYATLLALCSLALMQSAQGQLRAAVQTYQQAFQLAQGNQHQPAPYAGMAHIGLGAILYEWHELDHATHHLVEGIELSKQWGSREYILYGYTGLAITKMAQGHADEAVDLIKHVNEQMKGYHLPIWVAPLIATQQTRLLLLQGKVEAATHLAQNSMLGEFEHATQARLALAQKQPAHALELLEPQIPVLEATHQRKKVIEYRILQALAYAQQNDLSHGTLALQQALAQAEEEGFIRLFVDEGEPMAALLFKVLHQQQHAQNLPSERISPEYIRKLLHTLGVPIKRRAGPKQRTGESLVSPHSAREYLSKREMELIHYIAAGMSNDEIAQHLVIEKSTVAWHLKNIYSKLNVHNRAQVVVQARKLGLS